jgi:hypothetical protein
MIFLMDVQGFTSDDGAETGFKLFISTLSEYEGVLSPLFVVGHKEGARD